MQPDSNATRASLISRARELDSQAWSELVELYGPLVAHWCGRCGLDSQQAADGVQEVFASVSKALDKYESRRESGAFRAWLWTITANKVRDFYRRNQNQVTAQGGSTALGRLEQVAVVPDDEPTDDQQMDELLRRGMRQVQTEFESRTWDMFRRAVIDQVPTSVIAQEFDVSPAAVRQARSRVLRRLRQQLGDLDT
ncbi:MAG: sigma-70 family RNA polymerase sigma factor [Planctomycetota bacterium]